MKSRKLMIYQSTQLSPVISFSDGLPIYFLTGTLYLYQTLYCIKSLTEVSSVKFKFILVDDGTFDINLIERINIQLPGAEIVTREIIEQNIQKHLPESEYPHLHRKRKEYPHIKKLTDIHTIQGSPWKLVLDSDMLFWAEPKEIINWLSNPGQPLHMIDCVESYGYSYDLMEELSQSTIPPLVNVGAIGLNSETINWGNLEKWVKILETEEGKTYYLEQALSAMLIAKSISTVLDPENYIVNPSDKTINNNTGILHHYVDLSKEGYYKWAAPKILQSQLMPQKSASDI